MAEAILNTQKVTEFIELAKDSVVEGVENLKAKGIGIRFSSDYCNSVVKALRQKPEFKHFSDTEVKLALKPLFEASILNIVAKELAVIKE